MMSWVVGTDEFNKNLDDWLFKNDQKNATYFYKNVTKIPPTFRSYSKVLYRGMVVNDEFMKLIVEQKLVFKNHTSWSKDRNVARGFIDDKRFSIASSSGIKIIIEKLIPPSKQILDIEAYVGFFGVEQLELMGVDEMSLDSAVKEKEVLCTKGLTITENEVRIL